MIALSASLMGQSNFANGPNIITISPQSDSTFNDSTVVFTFNRDVIGWGTTITWDSIASGSATVKLQVSNIYTSDNDFWVDYSGSLLDTVTSTTGSLGWEDEYFHFRYGRFVFQDIDTLMASTATGSYVRINMFVKTQK